MSDVDCTPGSPPLASADLPGTEGRIGDAPEDFVVDEVPLYPASGEGEHLYAHIEKRNLTTRDAARALARAAGVDANAVGTAGMKDKHAVTRQWVSLPARGARPVEEWVLPEGLVVLELTRHKNKLRTGHTSGNHFRIRLVDVTDDAGERARAIVERLARRGLPNHFGAQRFGRGGKNVEQALAWLTGDGRDVPPFERKLFSSVVQSEVFNRYATARIALGLNAPLVGEVVRLEGTGSHFVVEDAEKEAPRWQSHDIHPTGPMIGPKMKAARGRPLEVEEAAAASLGLDGEKRQKLARFADGTRRDLLVWPKDVTIASPEPRTLVLEFFLPSGSYATGLVRELTREPFLPIMPAHADHGSGLRSGPE